MSTDETLSDPQFQVVQLVPAYGSFSDNNSDADSSRMVVDSSCTVSYEDLINNHHLFEDKLRDFLEGSGRTLKTPTVGGDSLDLHQLFVEVTTRGGLEKVIENRKCKEVIATFDFKKAMTNAAYVLRKIYLKTLFAFEHVYFFGEPLSSFWVREEAVKHLVDKSANHDQGTHQKLQRGSKIEGIIDGNFDDGYFVTMKIGAQELKGAFCLTPPASLETRRRRKKKAKVSQVDPYRPKFHRSGYNFFFSEQYQRLKAEYAGKERLLIREIGNLWSNLSPADRVVYQEMGAKDVERYKLEMAVYKSLTDFAAAIDVAATDDAAEADDAAADDEVEADDAMANDEVEADDAAANDEIEAEADDEADL